MAKAGGALRKRLPAEVFAFIGLAIVSFFMLVVSSQDLMHNFRDTRISLFSGIRGRVSDVSSSISQSVLSVQELFRLRVEHAELLEQIARFEQLERSAAEIREENNRLREQLGFSQALNYRHIPARLVGRDPDNLYSAIVINKGRRAGVTRDMAVIAWQGGGQALVGKVIEARTFDSLVMPLYDSNLLIASRFAFSRFEGIVEGQGERDEHLRMRFIPKRARDDINHGDLVITSGMGGVYPPDINIGRVIDVIYSDYEISMEAEIEPLIDFSRLEYVFVIEELVPYDDSVPDDVPYTDYYYPLWEYDDG